MPKLINLIGEEENQSITNAELGNVISRYKTERVNLLPAELQDDSTSVWLSKAKLLEFFTKNAEASGIRFYFGIIEDPFVSHDIHNIVLVGTTNDQEDQVSDNDWVLITKNVDSFPLEGPLDSLICPPPVERCKGRAF